MIKTIIIRAFMALALLASGPLASVAAACIDGHEAPVMVDTHADHNMGAMDKTGDMQNMTGCHGDCMEMLACDHKSAATPATLVANPSMEKFNAAAPVVLAFATRPSPPYKVTAVDELPVPPNPSLHARSVLFLI